jgi:hypothetical protein
MLIMEHSSNIILGVYLIIFGAATALLGSCKFHADPIIHKSAAFWYNDGLLRGLGSMLSDLGHVAGQICKPLT